MYIYSLVSAILLALASRVYGFWIFSFFALIPYFYTLNQKEKTSLQFSFLNSFFFGFLYSLIILCSGLSKYPPVLLIVSIICGVIFGFMGIVYEQLRQRNFIDIFIFAAVWVMFEWFRQQIFQDFDYTSIAYTSYGPVSFLSFASIGGIYLTSFLIVITNIFTGYTKIYEFDKKIQKIFFTVLVIVSLGYFSNKIYLNYGNISKHKVSFSTIQIDKSYAPYSLLNNGIITLRPEIDTLLKKAIAQNSDYVIYPYNLFQQIITDEDIKETYISSNFNKVNISLKKYIPDNQKFIFWSDTIRDKEQSKAYDEVDFWNNGSIIDFYEKRNIHPFYDISASYFREVGVIYQPYDFLASKENKIISIDAERFSDLNCSELNYSHLARGDSKIGSNIILSLGYSYVFRNFSLGILNLVLSQFRAVETNLPLIRADIRGPSVSIDKNGEIVSKLDQDSNDIFTTTIYVEDNPHKTIYTYLGNYPVIISLSMFIIYLYFKKYMKRNIL